MNLNIYFLANPGEFNYEGKLIRDRVINLLKQSRQDLHIKFITFFDLDFTQYSNIDYLKAFDGAYHLKDDYSGIYIFCFGDDYGYIPSKVNYDLIKYFSSDIELPDEPISLLEYELRCCHFFSFKKHLYDNRMLSIKRNLANRPDYPNNIFVDKANYQKARDFAYEMACREEVIDGDYPAWLTSDDTYRLYDEDLLVQGIYRDLSTIIDRIKKPVS